ncbi:hypothetical protein Tco_0577816, partial [Tanacetum coccineum]
RAIPFHLSRATCRPGKVNAQQGDHVDEVMLIRKTSEEECNKEFEALFQEYEVIKSLVMIIKL